jgi:cytidyltransferase-like protein
MSEVIVSGSFDDLRSGHVRFLDEAARLGKVHVLLWSDQMVSSQTGKPPKFSQEERLYFIESIRYTSQVTLIDHPTGAFSLQEEFCTPGAIWVVRQAANAPAVRNFCHKHGMTSKLIDVDHLRPFPHRRFSALSQPTGRKKVVVTGCFDWLHTGHVRFFEEVSQLGDLFVVVGSDENVGLLKGSGHPLFKQDERRYMVASIRFVAEALISTGMGWMDAEPEIALIRPDIYAVNEDGDKPEKRAFCAERNIEYAVLKRAPKAGLPRRESTQLRGF